MTHRGHLCRDCWEVNDILFLWQTHQARGPEVRELGPWTVKKDHDKDSDLVEVRKPSNIDRGDPSKEGQDVKSSVAKLLRSWTLEPDCPDSNSSSTTGNWLCYLV